MRCKNPSGQAVVEAAFLIPIVLILLMLLIQPGILLYDYMVMKGAASEGCRILATRTAVSGSEDAYRASIVRHLGSIPQQENFHVHESGCSWVISFQGDEAASRVKVSIENQAKPLPLISVAASALGLTNEAGNFTQRVEVERPSQNSWVQSSEDGSEPHAWVHRDDDLLEG